MLKRRAADDRVAGNWRRIDISAGARVRPGVCRVRSSQTDSTTRISCAARYRYTVKRPKVGGHPLAVPYLATFPTATAAILPSRSPSPSPPHIPRGRRSVATGEGYWPPWGATRAPETRTDRRPRRRILDSWRPRSWPDHRRSISCCSRIALAALLPHRTACTREPVDGAQLLPDFGKRFLQRAMRTAAIVRRRRQQRRCCCRCRCRLAVVKWTSVGRRRVYRASRFLFRLAITKASARVRHFYAPGEGAAATRGRHLPLLIRRMRVFNDDRGACGLPPHVGVRRQATDRICWRSCSFGSSLKLKSLQVVTPSKKIK